MQWKKQIVLAAVLLIALSMAAGAYHTEAATTSRTEINTQAFVLTQKTSIGGKIFFVINVQKLRQSYPQAIAVNIFMDTDPFAQITSTSVPLISNGEYNGITPPYNEHLKLDTAGASENYLIVSAELPSSNAWWAKVNQATGQDYTDGSTPVYLKIQIDQNTVAVMDGSFTVSNTTIIGKYQITNKQLSYTGFNATWYGGPETANTTNIVIQLLHPDGTPINMTNGEAKWIDYNVTMTNGYETYKLFDINATNTTSGDSEIINAASDVFNIPSNITILSADSNAFINETSQLNLTTGYLYDFPVTPTGNEGMFPVSEFREYYDVKISPLADEHYNSSFDSSNSVVTINITESTYLNITLTDSSTVFSQGTIGADGETGTLGYYTYNGTSGDFGSYSMNYVFNETSDEAYVVYNIIWNPAVPDNITVYPSIELSNPDPTVVGGSDHILGAQMNPGDKFEVTGHNLPSSAALNAICLAYWNGTAFETWNTSYTGGPTVNSVGIITGIVTIPDHWYGGETFYPIIKVNDTGTMVRTWVDAAQGLKIYPYVNASYLEYNGSWHGIDGEKLAPGDYILIKGYGFITTENLKPVITYDLSNLTMALSHIISVDNKVGLDTNGDGHIDAYLVKNDTLGKIALVIKLPTDINETLLSNEFKFGLLGTGDNVGLSLTNASKVVNDKDTAKVFIWPDDSSYARFHADTTTSLQITSTRHNLTVYPYPAHVINGVTDNETHVVVEIIGFPMWENATLTVNMTSTSINITLDQFNATDLTQGYKELTYEVPETYHNDLGILVNETNGNPTYTIEKQSYNNITINCIIGYKTGASAAYEKLTGGAVISSKPGDVIVFIGYGLINNTNGNITSLVPSLASPLVDVITDANGSFNVTLNTTELLQLTGRQSGVYKLKIFSEPCTVEFTLSLGAKPLFKISVKADDNAFVGDTIFVAIKLVYVLDNQQYSALNNNDVTLEGLTVWFIYGSGDVDNVSVTSLSSPPVVYVNKETGEIVITYTITHQPATDGLVIDALAKANIYGLYDVYSTDHTVVSVDTALNNKITSVNNTVKDEASNLSTQLSSVNESVTGAVYDAASQVTGAVNNAASGLSSAMDSYAAQILGAVNDEASSILMAVGSVNDTVKASASGLSSAMDSYAAQILGGITAVNESVTGAVNNAASQILSAVNTAAGQVTGAVNNAASGLSSAMDSYAAQILGGINKVNNNVENSAYELSSAISSVNSTVENSNKQVINAVNTAASNVNNKLNDMNSNINNIKNEVTSLQSNVDSKLQTLGQKVDSAINAAQNAGTAAQSAANAAQKANQKEDAISSKVDSISTTVEGIKSGSASLKTYAIVNAVLIIITLIIAAAVLMKVRP
ncbi:MAG: methyl-accepting chemotaxis protein [Desulfurococcales archaeon]|nr:methyl-accepting chemotaxis protein [Desulfurococcales archaeon]